jgi:hypothetical protein
MNSREEHLLSKYFIGVFTLSFLIYGCSAGRSSNIIQNTPASSSLQKTQIVETETPNEVTTPTPVPNFDKQNVKTKTPYLITPTNIPLENRNWYDPDPSFVLSNDEINDYLKVNIGKTSFGGEAFCAFTPLNNDRGGNGFIYLWILCQEYYLNQETLSEGTGLSLPVSLQLQDQNGHYIIIDHFTPRDGSYYGPDVKRLFPENTWDLIFPEYQDAVSKYNYRSSQLNQDVKRQAMSYFDVIFP